MSQGDNTGSGDGSSSSRRQMMRLAAGVAATGLLLRPTLALVAKKTGPKEKVTVLEGCVGCTGCVPVCPTAAIQVIAGAIAIEDKECVSCGYCVATCPVGGMRINNID